MLLRKLKLDWRYGVGEFVIVVMGVLVALGVDSWNDVRRDDDLEREYLSALKADLERDTAALSDAIMNAEDRSRSGGVVLASLGGSPIDVDPHDFIRWVHATYALSYPGYSRSTIKDLLSTGNLRLLRDRELRSRLDEYYSLIDYYEQFREVWRDLQVAMEHVIPELIDWDHRQAILAELGRQRQWVGGKFVATAADAERVVERIEAHPNARHRIQNMTRVQGTHHGHLVEIKALAIEVLDLISFGVDGARVAT